MQKYFQQICDHCFGGQKCLYVQNLLISLNKIKFTWEVSYPVSLPYRSLNNTNKYNYDIKINIIFIPRLANFFFSQPSQEPSLMFCTILFIVCINCCFLNVSSITTFPLHSLLYKHSTNFFHINDRCCIKSI